MHGANGIGKTTLLRAVLGSATICDGTLDVATPLKRIGYLPQLQNRFFHLPVTLADVISFSQSNDDLASDLLELGLLEPKHLSLDWNTASGGERKRTLLTRILLQKPNLLLLDEPLSHLDNESYDLVKNAIQKFITIAPGRAALVVEHESPPETFEGVTPKLLQLKADGIEGLS